MQQTQSDDSLRDSNRSRLNLSLTGGDWSAVLITLCVVLLLCTIGLFMKSLKDFVSTDPKAVATDISSQSLMSVRPRGIHPGKDGLTDPIENDPSELNSTMSP